MKRLGLVAGLVIVSLVAAFLVRSTPWSVAQSLIETIDVGNSPGATIADPIRNLVYVICNYDDTIHVIDGSSNTVVRTFSPPHGISAAALDPVANRLYVAACSPIHVLDVATGNEIGTIRECVQHPEELAVDPQRHRLIVADRSGLIGVSDYVNLYDTTTLERVAHIELGYSDQFRKVSVAVNAATGTGYSAYDIPPNVTFFDVTTGAVTKRVQDVGAWHGIAADPVRNRVYVRGSNQIAVLDGTTGASVGSIAAAGLIGLNSSGGRVYSWKSRDLHVFDAATLTEVGTVPGLGYPGYYASIAVLEGPGRVYCPLTYDDQVAAIQDVGTEPTLTPAPPTATPTRTATSVPSPTPTRTFTPGPSPTPTLTFTPGPFRTYLPLLLK